jgi:hypothetical protein
VGETRATNGVLLGGRSAIDRVVPRASLRRSVVQAANYENE